MILYRLIVSLLILPLGLALLLRDRSGLGERLGAAPSGPFDIWLHGASNGELASARPLLAELRAARPDLRVLVTANTLTGRSMAQADGHTAVLAPVDTRWALRRFLRRAKPRLLVTLESEVWPNRIFTAHMRGLPILMAGARMSEKSARVWGRVPSLADWVFSQITVLSPQDAASAERFRALGVQEAAMRPVLNLKALVPPLPVADAPAFPRDETVLAAATHDGEEAQVLEAFAAARQTRPDLRLILAPRHPRRAAAVRALAEAAGFGVAQRSRGEAPEASRPIYLADTMGEMAAWYAAASVTFVGGSLVDKGGHTPFEPAMAGTAILFGPSSRNFAAAYAALAAAGAALQISGPADLGDAMAALTGSAEARAMAERAPDALRPLADQGQIEALTEEILKIV